jgi:acyl-CoA synthetase (AMP-forming)/AMP-acid ligase II
MDNVSSPLITVGAILERGARAHPDREALVWQDERLTYQDLKDQTSSVCQWLRDQDLELGSRIALLGRNRIAYAVSLLGMMRSGYVAVPLNWRLAVEPITGILSRCNAETLLFTSEFKAIADELIQSGAIRRSLCIDGADAELLFCRRPEDVSHQPSATDVCAIISTGGTEGTPKGVTITHGGLAAGVVNTVTVDRPRPEDVSLVLPQMFHNPQVYLLPPLLVGAKLVIPDMLSFDAKVVLRTIEAERVTRFLGVATMINFLLEAQERLHADTSSLSLICYGGAPFAPRTVRRLKDVFGCGFLQLYGQTETGVHISALTEVDHEAGLADPTLAHLLLSAGRVLPLMEARVVDENGIDCARDRTTVGEIIARGPSVMPSYWHDPGQTSEKLRDGWCWTGDLATWDADGYLYIVDRRSQMIISGGENVFPKAVEDVLYEHPGVAEAAVIGMPDSTWGEVVTAVVVLRDQDVTESELAALCGDRLAGYMRPRRVHFVGELPKNATGKILRREIKALLSGDLDQGDHRRVGAN